MAVLLVFLNAKEKPDSETPVQTKPKSIRHEKDEKTLRDDDHDDHPFCE